MSINQLEAKARELKELKIMREELEAEITAIEDEIKAHMGTQEALTVGAYKLTYKPVTTARIDTTALKKALPEVAERFMKSTTCRRFLIA